MRFHLPAPFKNWGDHLKFLLVLSIDPLSLWKITMTEQVMPLPVKP